MGMTTRTIACVCILGFLVGIGAGCRRNASSGSRNFSHNFNSEKTEDLAIVAKMHDSLYRELESRGFKEVKTTEDPEMIKSFYEGEYDGFPLAIEIRRLLVISEEDPEFFYRVSFEESTDVAKIDKAAKDFRELMSTWCQS
ncbi:MAG: hypothetical protein HQ515_25050 [Phycisphaeraceae bacterium]|nr:hypothetical protein [Phycisphaeraceae bacterium]